MPLYAAYGTNLDPTVMKTRCPHSPLVGTGWLEGWRLTFGGGDLGGDGPLATVVEHPGHRVFVALYDLHPFDEAALDRWDGATGDGGEELYRKIHVRVATLDGDVTAWLYVLNGYEGGLPRPFMLNMIADAAERAGAPDDYVTALRSRPTSG